MTLEAGPFDILYDRLPPGVIPSPYCPGVLQGAWRASQDWASALRTRDLRRGDCRKSKRAALDTPVPLAQPTDYVPIGGNFMLLATDTYGWPPRTCGDNALSLAAEVHEDDTAMTCSRNITPCTRNAFVVVPEESGGLHLGYGQRFVLRPTNSQHLALRAEVPTLDTNLGRSKHPVVRLCARTDRYCYWTAWPSHPGLRLEATGSAVPAHARTVLRHEASGRCLAAETGHWGRLASGLIECEATIHSVLDNHGKETEPNFWAFVVQKPPEIYTPVLPGGCE